MTPANPPLSRKRHQAEAQRSERALSFVVVVAVVVVCSSPSHPKIHVISTEGGALCRRSGEIPVFVFAVAVVVCSPHAPKTNVISTVGGALAAAAERFLYLSLLSATQSCQEPKQRKPASSKVNTVAHQLAPLFIMEEARQSRE
jgi:hypothetical protein